MTDDQKTRKQLIDELRELRKENAELKTAEKECRRLEEESKKQAEFLSSVLESLPHPFYVVDARDYTIRMANSATYTTYSIGKSICYALTHNKNLPCGSEGYPCPLEIIKRTGEPVTVEHIHYDKDGNRRDVEVHGSPIFDSNGDLSEIIEYALDITERKRVEKERERLVGELKNALAEVKTLSGLLPICSACKKVRDDRGYWNQIEIYLKEHANATFTHSLCPDCAEKTISEIERLKK